MRLSFCLHNKYLIKHEQGHMLLDQLFEKSEPKQIVIVRKNGKLSHEARPVHPRPDLPQQSKPLFPISKERR